jgi:hypothetical protein
LPGLPPGTDPNLGLEAGLETYPARLVVRR